MPLAVYVHIPFCRARCPYCHFNTVVRPRIPEQDYVAALIQELNGVYARERLDGRALSSIYFGGGTPSLFSPGSIGRIIETVLMRFGGGSAGEVTLEVFPEMDSLKRLSDYREAGVSRVSFGMQAMSATDREALWRGRSSGPEDTLECARKAGFENVSFDYLYGRPGQSVDEWRMEIAAILRLGLPHISLYLLTPEDDTPLISLLGAGRLTLPPDEDSSEMTLAGWEGLRSAGYAQYEISNFARTGHECAHNLTYWYSGAEYLGLGAGAHSNLGSRRWENTLLPEEYMRQCSDGVEPVRTSSLLNELDRMREFFYLGLRLEQGVARSDFRGRFGVRADDAFPNMFEMGRREELLEMVEDRVSLTVKGRLYSDTLFRELF